MIRNSSSTPARPTRLATTTRSSASLSPARPRWTQMARRFRSRRTPSTGGRFAADQAPDHHLGVALVHEPRRRRHPRHHRRRSPARRPPSPSRRPTRPTARRRRSRSTSSSATTRDRRPLRRSVMSISSRTPTQSSASAYENTSTLVTLAGQNTYPDTSVKVPLTYTLVSEPEPWHCQQFQRVDGHVQLHAGPRIYGDRHIQVRRDGQWARSIRPRRRPAIPRASP